MFNSKRNGEDCVERFPGRLLAKDFARSFGLDFIVAWLGTPRILHALVVFDARLTQRGGSINEHPFGRRVVRFGAARNRTVAEGTRVPTPDELL